MWDFSGIEIDIFWVQNDAFGTLTDMQSELILKDLREQFGQQTVLYAEDLAKLLGSDHRVVKTLLNQQSIPIAVKKVGNRVGVTIYEVAEWLSKSEHFQAPTANKTLKQVKAPARARASLGRSLIALQTQIDFLTDIYIELGHLEIDEQSVRLAEALAHPPRIKTIKRLK